MLWFYCDNETGAILTGGMTPDEITAQRAGDDTPEGASFHMVPNGTVMNMFTPQPNFSILQKLLYDQIDRDAGATRVQYVTDVPGQAQTYEKKEQEARTWQAGDEDSHYPFMAAEAAERALTMEQVRDDIMVQVNLLTPIAARIEAKRVASKEKVRNATTLPAILAAADVNWNDVVAVTPA